jgi:transcriptional regulator with XRE-family HTH domain
MLKIKEFAARKGLSLKELAKKLGVKPETVYKWAAGTNTPTYDIIRELKRLGITDYELFGEVFAEHEEIYLNRVMKATSRFLEDLGINTNTKEKT